MRSDYDAGGGGLRREYRDCGRAAAASAVAKLCEDYGQRVQNSVFECWVDMAKWVAFRARLLKEIAAERDSLRFYFLGDNWKGGWSMWGRRRRTIRRGR